MVAPNTRRRVPELVWWALAIVTAVVVVPMTAYFFGDSPLEFPAQPGATDRSAEATSFDLGMVYEVAETLTIPVGEEGVPLLDGTPGPAGPLALLAAFPGSDGGAWTITLPADSAPELRVTRHEDDGARTSSFEVPSGVALAAPGRAGDVWLGFAASGPDSVEMVRRYGQEGELLGEYTLPPGVFVRSLCVTTNNELWAQLEEYANLADELASVYSSDLIPVAVSADLLQAQDQLETAVDGAFFGEDGLRYVVDSELIPYAGDFEFPASVVRALSGDREVSQVRTPAGWRPFAADAEGRVWCEPLPLPSPSDTVGYETIGDQTPLTVELRAFDASGLAARIPVQRPRLLNEFGSLARIIGTSASVLRVGDEGVSLLSLEPTDGERVGRPATVLDDPELTLISGPLAPIDGNPYHARDAVERDVMRLIHAGLVRPEANGAVADIAREIPSPANGGVSTDGLTITYSIDTSRRWHDGSAVSPHDVVATWEFLSSVGTVVNDLFPGAEYIETVRADGESLIVELSEVYGPGPETFFPFVLPAAMLETEGVGANAPVWSLPVGAGPYRMHSWSEDGRWRLEAAGAATISRLDVVFAADGAALSAFQGSSTPAVWLRVPDHTTLDIERDGVGSLLSAPTGYWRGLIFNEEDPVLSDPAVRRAIMLMLPGDVWAGLFPASSAAPVGVFAGSDPRAPVAAAGPDVARAKRVLDAAGWRDHDGDGVREKDGRVLEVRYSLTIRDGRDEVSFEEVEIIEEVWKAAGIKPGRQFGAVFMYTPWHMNGYIAVGQSQVAFGVFPAPVDPGVGSLFDPDDVPGPDDNAGLSVTRTRDRVLRGLHEDARAEYDPARRAAIGIDVLDRAADLDLFAVQRPDMRTLAVIGAIDGLAPEAYPAGTLWNIGSWSLDDGGAR